MLIFTNYFEFPPIKLFNLIWIDLYPIFGNYFFVLFFYFSDTVICLFSWFQMQFVFFFWFKFYIPKLDNSASYMINWCFYKYIAPNIGLYGDPIFKILVLHLYPIPWGISENSEAPWECPSNQIFNHKLLSYIIT